MMRPRLPATMWAGLALIVLPGLALVWLELYIANVKAPAVQHNRELVAHTFEVIATAEALRDALKDAERAQRGYLLTSDRAYLQPYGSGARSAPELLVKLRKLTEDSAEQQRRLPSLEQQVRIKLDELARTISAYDGRDKPAALDIVQTKIGMDAMQSINLILNATVATERDLLWRRTEQAADEERSIAQFALLGSLLGFTVMAAGAIMMLLAFRDTLRAQEATEAAARELRAKQQEITQYQKMEALGQLTGGIAHDFNNLIHVIKNALELIARRLDPVSPEVRGYIEMADRNADRAASLTQRLLAFSRRQVLDPQPIEPNALLAEVAALLRQTLGEHIAIEAVAGAGAWWIHADAPQLETAILNLALNARDAMPKGGKLTIEVSNAYLDETYAAAHAEVKPGQFVMIAVSDTGTGMAKEVVERAFEPFFTTKETGRGTGLGLSQVYGFAKQSSGHIKIYSEPGKGTTAKLYLPRLQGEPAQAPAIATPPVQGDVPAATVLVVEDDEDVRKFTVEVLSSLGYRILAARDANAALQALESVPVDLLFTDVGLPDGLNGRELADEAQRRKPGLRVLFTTGYTRNAIIHHGRLDPGVDLLPKPFTQSNLTDKIRQALRAA
jgi:signal transduction histidine kinase